MVAKEKVFMANYIDTLLIDLNDSCDMYKVYYIG